MALVPKTDSESWYLTEGSSPGARVGSFEQFYLDEDEFVDDGSFPFIGPFTHTPTDVGYTARTADTLDQIVEMVLWADSEYPVVEAILYEPDGTLLLDGTETVTFDATMPGTTISRPCTHDGAGAVQFAWNAGADPGVYQARWTVVTETRRLSVPTVAVTLRIADEP